MAYLMRFFKAIEKKEIVLIVNNEYITDKLTNKILKISSKHEKTGIDMRNVKSINSEKFIYALLNNEFKLFNLKNEVLLYLSLILKDGFLKSYMNKSDFSENKRELVKRHFYVA